MRVQPTLDAEEGFPDGFVERVRLKNVKFASIDESLDSKSKNFKRGSEVDFDIIHRTVVLVDKGSIPRRSVASESTVHPVAAGMATPKLSSFAYM